MPSQPPNPFPSHPSELNRNPPGNNPKTGPADILTLGFATAVAMWAMGYVGHMPLTQLPTAVFVSAMLACLIVGGFLAGRYTHRGIRGGLYVGLIAAILNLLILGSLLHQKSPNAPDPSLWLPGTLLLSISLSTVGALIAHLTTARSPAITPPTTLASSRTPTHTTNPNPNWPALFAAVTAAAALLLIAVGGLVTGFRAGLAVPDWPNSYGANMFLFPFQRMTGGIFYEHAHRLLGSLVGFATLTLAIYLTFLRPTVFVVIFAWLIGFCVAIQGTLGGLRVTENIPILAVVHGFFAHCVLAGLVALTVLLTRPWQHPAEIDVRTSAGADRFLSTSLVLLILAQTFLGALVRQLNILLMLHITVAVLVAALTLFVGMRAWGLNPRQPILRRTGITILCVVLLQLTLGVFAIMYRTPPVDESPLATTTAPQLLPAVSPTQALLTTAHQTNAALLLATAVTLALYSRRFLNTKLPIVQLPINYQEKDVLA